MKFLLLFLVLNSFFFFPRYVLERKTSTFFPYKGLFYGPVKERIQFLINRFNYDIFRLSIDFFLLTLLFSVFQNRLSFNAWHWLFFVIYALTLTYQIYYHVFENIYKVEPLFYRDFLLLKTGAQIFFREFTKINAAITLMVLGGFVGLFFLTEIFLRAAVDFRPTAWIWGIAGVLGFMSLYSLFNYNYKAFGKIVFPSTIQSLIRNILFSYQTKVQLDNVDFEKLKNHRPYEHLKLRNRPNIYFIPVESYGRILYDHVELKESYRLYMSALDDLLRENSWQATTNLSLAPITGGASWVSYSSALSGFDIRDQGVYLTLLNKPEMHDYQHFMRWLKNMGYANYRLAPIAGFQGMKIPWETYSSFYAIDEWIKYEDMNYTGPLLGFGPCPPDQFSLGFAKAFMDSKQTEPNCLFFITQNSHSPFVAPEKIADHWAEWSDGSQVEQGSSSIFIQPKLEDYARAIRYQMTFLTDFIMKEGADNDIFVLIGDHQPPSFPQEGDSLETPVHIISKNADFVNSFSSYGFQKGLIKKDQGNGMRHEGIYSLLVRELVRHYGEKDHKLPEYKEQGLDWLNL
ncbi:MAG: sulfatase-like hydrolase/transferase [Saprospiraceae bacterium]|nr:sulfatase-like hydrolase/transferase [Saprospiraceae bacterium]MCB9323657.1 sulfatase-like hydrolase/transferase [Lewinellaceae bacterium]